MAPTPNAAPVSKVEKFKWADPGVKGEFRWIPKDQITGIDGAYQRDVVSEGKVTKIAAAWSWMACGTLVVVERPDGTFWVIDGGHRVRASFLRGDILELPCMVYRLDSLSAEAQAFLVINTTRVSVDSYTKHRAAVLSGNEDSMEMEEMVAVCGYKVSKSSGRGFFGALVALARMWKENRELARKVFCTCANEIAQDHEPITKDVMESIFRCQVKVKGEDILAGKYLTTLKLVGLEAIGNAIRREEVRIGKAGSLVGARAVLDLLNKGRGGKKLEFS